ncbi:MAG TPA: endolytic transglycosylase MltG [Negativicutes bacterium]|uniref:Endolytic murein transglycosylase n=1 Tax=Candidatus Staskawiczbacteria bacterium RIFCSPHIGHO2_01_FULL_41_41 TaxID=1802203 RepID=A0A1G2HV27_9BACT|nr:MAG: hypothetical protein A2822_02185 [Candidatus Staskawiczbacteria bacterium RIFCSPHIGHO2_01_FULL_41_41]OGZ69133.1 MAG: hypothetical protein A3C50_01925 [Candidatus Staskawiczbacteria bacterium RIFCSPHIGHO2_02_FULL_43_16]OGZ74439.1 MAG: hypothetical protein A3A12_01565 [Candidatus Staskawiczbacteria bacterium RIFCSPLOWO2_01_FULL_43_17b]HLD70724.1 endolytic transglycosylase MltG [Negativicutes bacterium]
MKFKLTKKIKTAVLIILGILCLVLVWEIFVPKSFTPKEPVVYNAESGLGQAEIANDLESQGVIKNSFFFKLYSFISGNAGRLQAGIYDFSPSMSIAGIVNRLAKGDVMKNRVVVLEGWDIDDIAKYVGAKKFYFKDEFIKATKADYSDEFSFLKNRPKGAGLEGYIFPDTYSVPAHIMPHDFIKTALANFDKRLTPKLRAEIAKQKKTIFQIVTMASILEKEVPSLADKKIVAGILWKRINSGMALQVDSTINYITGKSDSRATLADLKIDSKYNTYKYLGLPAGPISNPGMESILAAIYPTKSQYWFYLSADGTGETVYSRTFKDHKVAISKYLREQ